MVALNCPLCCNETFTSAASLKSHLIDILENILCPICHERFDKLDKLIEHLEDDCSIKESILAKALLRSPKKEEESEYYCQMCDSHFDDIDEHLKKFHEGQEIIVEEACTDAGNESTDPTVIILNTNEEDSQQSPTDENSPSPVSEVDIKDKDGRLYTRKFVKIDKFWLQDTQDKPIETPISPTSNIKYVEYSKCQFCKSYLPAVHLSTHECPSESRPKIKTIKVHLCEICKTTFPTFKSLRLHRRMHEPIKKQKIEAPANYEEGEEPLREMFICTICNKTYDKEYEEVHMHSHQFNSEFNCEICNRKFFTKTNLEMHMKAHTNNKKFACSYCKKPFVTYDALNNHVLTECQKRAYVCNYCGRRFTRPHEKVKHERIHTGEKPHVCEVCGKAFRVSYCLTLHLRTHSGTRPYQCKHCGKRFKSHSVYNHHLLTHSDVRAYKCPYCPKAFKTSVQLAGHKNSHIKPFTCTDCNRPFASLYAVRAHMETHKRVNNLKYECWMCGALYSRAFALRDHLKQQHQQVEGEKVKAEVVTVSVDEEMEAANSILVNEDDDIILGLDRASNIEIMENEGE